MLYQRKQPEQDKWVRFLESIVQLITAEKTEIRCVTRPPGTSRARAQVQAKEEDGVMKQFLAGVLIGGLVLGLTLHAKDSAREKIVQPQVLVDNQKVKMVRWTLQPGERSPVHTHSLDHIYVVVHGSKIREYVSDGKISDDEQETGRAALSVAKGKTHSFENIGAEPYEMVSIELK